MKTDEQRIKGLEVYRKVKGGFISQGFSLTKWCKENGTSASNIRHAFYGSWDGPRADALVKKAMVDSGVELPEAS